MLPLQAKADLQKYISSHDGVPLNHADLLKPNEVVKKIMVARLLSMTDEQRRSLVGIFTPQTMVALNILLPGLHRLVERKANGG